MVAILHQNSWLRSGKARFSLLVRIALAVVFIYAGASKLLDIEAFARVIDEYGIVARPYSGIVALLLPVFEVVAGGALVFNVRGSLVAITCMTVLFLGVLGYAMAAGLTIGDCGCFEPGELPPGVEDGSMLRNAFLRDVGLLIACVYLFRSGTVESTLLLPIQKIEERV